MAAVDLKQGTIIKYKQQKSSENVLWHKHTVHGIGTNYPDADSVIRTWPCLPDEVKVRREKVAFAGTLVALIKEARLADGSIVIICWTTASEFMSKNNQMEKLLFGAMMPFRWPKGMQVSH